MNGGLTIERELEYEELAESVVTLRVRGVLDAYSAAELRAALLTTIAEQPAGIILGVAGLTIADDVGLAVLASLAQQNRRWPAIGLVISGAGEEFTAAAHQMGVTPYVPICPDDKVALEEIRRSPARLVRRDHIRPDRQAPGVARAAVQEFCADHGVDGSTEAAQLVASELVTNAVVHAKTPIDLTLRLEPSLLHIAVRDTGDGQVRITGTVDESAESGRGLVLVDALAASWGVFVPDTGKIVWAAVRVRMARNSL